MLANWEDPYWAPGDLNNNGYFNVIDFSILLGQWGTICFGAELDPFYREKKISIEYENASGLLDLLNKYRSNGTGSN